MIDPSLLTTLLGATAGLGQAGQQANQQAPNPQNPAPVNVAQAPDQVPQDSQAIQSSTPGVNDFQPSQLSAGQRRFDRLLAMHGAQPYWQNRVMNQDIARAMTNYTNDPMGTIQNIASIPGAAPMAMNMYQELQQNQRLGVQTQTGQNQVTDMIRGRVANILAKATPDNYSQVLGMANNYIKQNGQNPADYDLPQSYDKDGINEFVAGTMTPDQQGVLDYRSEAAKDLGAYRETMAAARTQQVQNQGAHWQQMAKQAAINQTNSSNKQIQAHNLKYGYNMPIQTSHGQMIMQVGPGGTHATVDYPDGNGGTQTFAYKSDGKGGWQKIGRIDPQTGKAWASQ